MAVRSCCADNGRQRGGLFRWRLGLCSCGCCAILLVYKKKRLEMVEALNEWFERTGYEWFKVKS